MNNLSKKRKWLIMAVVILAIIVFSSFINRNNNNVLPTVTQASSLYSESIAQTQGFTFTDEDLISCAQQILCGYYADAEFSSDVSDYEFVRAGASYGVYGIGGKFSKGNFQIVVDFGDDHKSRTLVSLEVNGKSIYPEPEKPIVFKGTGTDIIQDVDIPSGEYIAKVDVKSDVQTTIRFYYGEGKYDFNTLANEYSGEYSGTVLLKNRSVDEVKGGRVEVETGGSWSITIERLEQTAKFPISGKGDTVTGIFEGSGGSEIFKLKHNSTDRFAINQFIVELYKCGGSSLSREILVNHLGSPYDGDVIAHTEAGEKYFFVVRSDGDWLISK